MAAQRTAPSGCAPGRILANVDRLFKEYVLGNERFTALNDVSLSVRRGEFVAVAGPSGSGKTTLLNIVGCIDRPSEGSVYLNGRDVSGLDPNALADLRKTEIGFIFQTFNLIPVLSARENVEYPLLRRGLTRGERRERVEYFLRIVGLERFMDHRPNELSGGQRQRVAIARALGVGPAVVLADEPTANLDHRTGQSILELMYSINEEHGTTFIFSTHDAKVIQMAKRVVKIAFGEIVDAGYQFESP